MVANALNNEEIYIVFAPTAQELLDQLPVTLEATGYDLQLLKNQYRYYRAFYTIGWTEIEGDDFESFEESFHCDLKYEKGNELLDILETIYRAGQQSPKAQ